MNTTTKDLNYYAKHHNNVIKRKEEASANRQERALVMFQLHYQEKLTYAQIGKRMGISRQRVCQILKAESARIAKQEANSTED